MSQPVLEVGIGANLTPFEKAIGELHQEIRQLGASISQAGQQATGGYTRAMGQAGKVTDDLSGFIKTQRMEQRQQSFLFRESAGIIGSITFSMLALSNATGANSKEMQRLNSVLVAGYTSFQAADFAMAALGISSGGVATAFKLIVGIGAALLTFFSSAKKETNDLTRETLALNAALRNTDAILANRAKRVSDLSGKRLQSELDTRLRTIDMFEKELANIEVLLATASDEDKKKLEGAKSIIGGRVKAEWELVNAVMEERKQRSGLISNLEREIEILQEIKKHASDIAEIRLLDQRIETKTLELGMAQRGTDLAREVSLNKNLQSWLAMQGAVTKVDDVVKQLNRNIANLHPSKPTKVGLIDISTPVSGGENAEYLANLINMKEKEKQIWMDAHQFEMSLISGLTSGVYSMFDQFLIVHRQAKNQMDATWLSIENTVISSLANIFAKWIEQEIIGAALQTAATAATVASMAAISAAAAPAATLVSIASFGAAAGVGTASVLAGLAAVQLASLPRLASGGLAYSPSHVIVGDNPNASFDPEVIAPLSKLQTIGTQNIRLTGEWKMKGRDMYLVVENYKNGQGRQ